MKDLEKCNIVDNNSKNPLCGALHVRQFFVSFVSLKGEVTAKRIGFGIRQTRIQCPGLQHVSRSFRGQPLELSKFPHLGERGPCPKSQWIWNGKTQSKLLKCTSSNVFILKSVSYKSQEQETCVAFERLGSGDGKRVPWGGGSSFSLFQTFSLWDCMDAHPCLSRHIWCNDSYLFPDRHSPFVPGHRDITHPQLREQVDDSSFLWAPVTTSCRGTSSCQLLPGVSARMMNFCRIDEIM